MLSIRQRLSCYTCANRLCIKSSTSLNHRRATFASLKFSTGRPRGQDTEAAANTTESPLIRPFSPELPSVNVRRLDGSTTRYNICPTPKANREKLSQALEELLSQDDGSSTAQSVSSARWLLDERGDAIHRHLTFGSGQEAARFQAELLAAANDMKHHPHVVGDIALTITCTTHNPRGLSMRDIKLARKVDDLALLYHAQNSAVYTSVSDLEQQRKGRATNRQAIDDALEKRSGTCFD